MFYLPDQGGVEKGRNDIYEEQKIRVPPALLPHAVLPDRTLGGASSEVVELQFYHC